MSLALRIGWLAGRLRNMSVPELGHRVREAARKQTARRWRQEWTRYASSGPCPELPGLRARLHAADPALRAHIAESAARFRAGHFEALGVRWPAALVDMSFPASVWCTDPSSGREWPGAGHYCFDIPYRLASGVGDIKHVWEFGRLQFLPLLAADHALNGTPESLAAVEAALESWYRHNPPFQGVHWAELLNVAIRAISVLVALSWCGSALSEATVQRTRALLAAHARLLALFPSRYSSANNHWVAELAAEYLLALALPELPGAAGVRQHARAALELEAALQLLPDGVPAEQSPSYGAFTAEFLLLVHGVAQAAGEPLPAQALDRLARFSSHVQALANGRNQVPSLCDNDEGRVLNACQHEPDYPMAIATSIAAVLGQAVQARQLPATRLRDAVFGRARRIDPADTLQRRCLDGGYSVDRRQVAGRRCIFGLDHGPLGYLSIAAHGHADALSVVLDVDDVPVLVDPGTYLYHAGGAWRDWFRSTAAHNTLHLPGLDQSRMAGPFNWRTKARARLDETHPGEAWRWRASHDGYLHSRGLRHERTVHALPDGYRISDALLGPGRDRRASVVFQLGLGLQAKPIEGGFRVYRGAELMLCLHFRAPGALQCERGGEPGQGGWVSPRFGVREPADRIVWTGVLPAEGAVVDLQVMPAAAPAVAATAAAVSRPAACAPGARWEA